MARLPVPGSDDGTWGNVLNTFLEVSHTSTGTLGNGVVGTAQLANGAVTNAKVSSSAAIDSSKLSNDVQNSLTNADSAYQKPSGGIPSTDMTTAVINSLNSANSSVQKVNSKIPSGGNVNIGVADLTDVSGASGATNNQVLAYDSGSGNWVPSTVSSSSVPDANPTTKGIVQLTGDLGGTATSPTVVKLNGTTLPLSSPTNGQVLTANGSGGTTWSTPSGGSSTLAADTDVNLTSPSDGQLLTYNGGSNKWINQSPAFVDLSSPQTINGTKTFGSTIVANISGNAATATTATNATNATNATTAATVTTIPALSGDVTSSGSSNVTTVAKINGVTVPSSQPTNGQVLTANGTGGSTWSTPSGGGSSSLAADTDVNLTSPTSGQVLTYDSGSTKWVNLAAPTASNANSSTPGLIQLTGDLGGTATSPTVVKLNGTTLPLSSPTNGQVLTANGSGGTTWSTPSGGSSTLAADTDVSITSPSGQQALVYNSGTLKWQNTNIDLRYGLEGTACTITCGATSATGPGSTSWTPTSSGTNPGRLVLDATACGTFVVTLSSNVTTIIIDAQPSMSATTSTKCMIHFVQDSTGGYTVPWSNTSTYGSGGATQYAFQNGIIVYPTVSASSRSKFALECSMYNGSVPIFDVSEAGSYS